MMQEPEGKGEGREEWRTRVKICGLTREEDALLAARLGADFLGFIFAPVSPRRVSVGQARAIQQALDQSQEKRPGLRTVGVFLGQERAEAEACMEESGLDLIQWHDFPVTGAVQGEGFSRELIARINPRAWPGAFLPASIYLLDPGQGSGETFPWEAWPGLAALLALGVPLLWAGGLRPENVARLVREQSPWGVDVASGVEQEVGKKDPGKLRQFFREIAGAKGPRRAAGQESPGWVKTRGGF